MSHLASRAGFQKHAMDSALGQALNYDDRLLKSCVSSETQHTTRVMAECRGGCQGAATHPHYSQTTSGLVGKEPHSGCRGVKRGSRTWIMNPPLAEGRRRNVFPPFCGDLGSSLPEEGYFWSHLSRKTQQMGTRGMRINPAPSTEEQTDNNFCCVSTLPIESWSQILTDYKSIWVWLPSLPGFKRHVA